MKAAFYDGNNNMEIKEHPDPVPKAGEVLVNIKSTGICGSDLNMNKAKNSADQDPAGHEVAGEIIDVGEGVDKQFIGKRIALEVLGSGKSCNLCWFCRHGQYTHCSDKKGSSSGGFAE